MCRHGRVEVCNAVTELGSPAVGCSEALPLPASHCFGTGALHTYVGEAIERSELAAPCHARCHAQLVPTPVFSTALPAASVVGGRSLAVQSHGSEVMGIALGARFWLTDLTLAAPAAAAVSNLRGWLKRQMSKFLWS